MRKTFIHYVLAALVLTLLATPAPAATQTAIGNSEVAIEVRSGSVYDYLLIGMNANATDGRDGLYDTMSPGIGINDQYILMVIPHPEWNASKTDFRTDFRAVKASGIWDTTVTTNLPDGTTLTMSIDQEQTKLPAGSAVVVQDMATGAVQDLGQAEYVFPVKTSGIAQQFKITLQMPQNVEKDKDKDDKEEKGHKHDKHHKDNHQKDR